MIPFTETMRHAHPLTPDDWVLEIGAHKGFDSRIFANQFGCQVIAYEPVREFYDELRQPTLNQKLVMPILAGVGGSNRAAMLGIKGELTGEMRSSDPQVAVHLLDIRDVLKNWRLQFGKPPALLQINAEGAEYDIFEAIWTADLMRELPRIQVQFHAVVPDYKKRYDGIRSFMAVTHEHLWQPGDFDTGWVGWGLRK